MRILQVNKFHWVKGGSERYYFDLVNGLTSRGHDVAVFASHHPDNQATPWSRHFAPGADYHGAGPLTALKLAGEVIDNKPAAAALEGLLADFRPDIAHLHNIHHQLSPSILRVFEKVGVPVVQTLHDYKWVCPAYLFLSHGKVCERCGPGNRFTPLLVRGCHHGCHLKSAIVWKESSDSWGRGDVERVGRFLAPSRFLREKVVAHGVPAERVEVRPYFLNLERYRVADVPAGDHLLYAGRLSKEKGLATLFDALARRPHLKLRIAGTGPLESALRARAHAENLDVEFLGHLAQEALHDAIRAARAVVVPSEWYENQPYAVLEAMALGVPVVASAIGGLPELVAPNQTGWLVPNGDADMLAWAMDEAHLDADAARELGLRGRAKMEAEFAAGPALESLEKLYARVIG